MSFKSYSEFVWQLLKVIYCIKISHNQYFAIIPNKSLEINNTLYLSNILYLLVKRHSCQYFFIILNEVKNLYYNYLNSTLKAQNYYHLILIIQNKYIRLYNI